MAIYELLVKNLTPPFAPATSMHFHYRVTLLDIVDVFVLLRCMTL